jgi:hypothetical protein
MTAIAPSIHANDCGQAQAMELTYRCAVNSWQRKANRIFQLLFKL